MTISTTANKIIYSGNGVTVSFPFTFPAIAAADILAYYTDSSGNITTLVQGSGTTQYQVSITAAIPPNPTGAGGTVTYNPSGTPIAVGTTLTIIRTQSLIQATSLANQGTLYPAVIEQAFDSLLAQTQQLNELLGRAISVAVSDPTPANLPAAAARANKYLSFDSNGNPTASATSPGTTPVSSVMAAFVNAASLASARTLLGLGNIAVETIGAGLQDDGAGTLRVNLEITTADTTNQTVTSAFHDTQRVATGPITYALPRANTLWNGFNLRVENLQTGGDITFSVNAADTFVNYSSGTSFIIGRGASIEIWTDAAASGTWYYRLSGGKKLVGDAAYTITPGDRNILTSAALTTTRTWTLPAASAVKAGTLITIADQANAVTTTNTLIISRAGADTIVAQGTTVASMTLRNAGNSISLISDGVSKWDIIALRFKPTVQKFTAVTSGTYTPPVGCSYLRVTMCAGGGGGGAVITNNGAVGTNTTFGSWGAVAGGFGAAANGSGGSGGSGGSDDTTTGIVILRQAGSSGTGGANPAGAFAGAGGNNPFGGAGLVSGGANAAGQNAVANTGGGGSGASGGNSGGGGGAGEYVVFFVFTPAAVAYAIGGGGAGGPAGTAAGGAGGSGIIIVEEFYN